MIPNEPLNESEEMETAPEDLNFGGDADQFDDLMSGYLDSMSELEVGQLARATVIEIKKDYVLLDVGDKAEGVTDIREFQDFKGNLTVEAGQEVEVVIEGRDSDTGQLRVSYRKARQRTQWALVVDAFEKQVPMHGLVIRALKNGLLVDVGVPCFLPASQFDLTRLENLESAVGQEIDAYVIDIDRGRRRGVLSRRKLLLEEQKRKRAEILSGIAEGQTLEGRIKSVMDFGVFVDLGGLDALVPREEVSWKKHVNVAETLKPGNTYQFVVTAVDREKERVTLSHRQISPDPWLTIEQDYPQGQVVKGIVTNLTNNCAYLVLGEGVEGRIHRNDLSWSSSARKPSDVLKKNDETESVVLGYDREKRLLELGLKQMTPDPWENIHEKYPKGSRQKVKVTDLVSFGAFVQVDESTKGLIHISDMSWDRNFKDPKQLVKPGEEIEAVVLKIDPETRRINFGLKQLTEDPFVVFVRENKQGGYVTGKVKSITNFGVFVELAPLVEGLIHVSQWDREKTENLESVVKPGDEVTAKILKIESKIQKISLSRKAYLIDEERREVAQYTQEGPVKATTSLGSLLKDLKINVGE